MIQPAQREAGPAGAVLDAPGRQSTWASASEPNSRRCRRTESPTPIPGSATRLPPWSPRRDWRSRPT